MKDLEVKINQLSEKEQKVIDIAYSSIYFNDSSDYRKAIWDIIKVVLQDKELIKKIQNADERELFEILCDYQ